MQEPGNLRTDGDTPAGEDRRLERLRRWLAQIPGCAGADLRPASGDASFRRYFRIRSGGTTRIVMDAPPPMEDCRPFVAVAAHLDAMGLNAPRVLEADLEQGFLLLTDLGTRQYLHELAADPGRAERLYSDALDALARMQRQGRDVQGELPPYDEALLRFELSLFHDWLCERHLGIDFSPAEERRWQATCDLLVDSALSQPRVFVHRDYHSRNLMVTAENNPGILDFQDAVEGPATYDLVSLLKDCYVRWPAEQIAAWAAGFHDRIADTPAGRLSRNDFLHRFELMGVQRHLKAAGIFARLKHRDGKARYLEDVPRTLGYIAEAAPRHPELAFLGELVTGRCLPGMDAAT